MIIAPYVSMPQGLTKIENPHVLETYTVRGGYEADEIHNGAILWEGDHWYFEYHHEYDEGNVYIVYAYNSDPKAYFTLCN